MIDGWNQQAIVDGINWEWGHGHLQSKKYDPYDPFTIQDGHDILATTEQNNLTPVLLRNGTIYLQGRMMPITIKGIDIHQKTLHLPTKLIAESNTKLPVIIGERMASAAKLKQGDEILLRWRDKNGTYDANSITIVGIFKSNVPFIDVGQIWMSIDKLREITELKNQTSYFIANENYKPKELNDWNFVSLELLMKEQTKLIKTKKASGSILYIILMTLALLVIFDTQVLSIFRRQKEIGTFIALGMTRWQVVGMFTAEGGMYSIFATVLAAIYGIPTLWFLSSIGISFSTSGDEFGAIMAERMYPVYSLELIIGTTLLVIISATIISFMPSHKITKMNPVDALKGKIS